VETVRSELASAIVRLCDAWMRLGLFLVRNGKLDEADKYFIMAAELASSNAESDVFKLYSFPGQNAAPEIAYKALRLRLKHTVKDPEVSSVLEHKCSTYKSVALQSFRAQVVQHRDRFDKYKPQSDASQHMREISLRPPWWRRLLRIFKRFDSGDQSSFLQELR